MNVLVCIKQVLDPDGDVRFREESGNFFMEGSQYILNPFDRFALEIGFRIRDEKGGKIKAICVGPPRCDAALKECLMLGIDEAIHVIPETFEMLDPFLNSYYLSKTVKESEYDLILCGKQSIDYEWGQTGIWIAERLGIPHVSEVIDLQIKGVKLCCRKQLENGVVLIETPLPAVITVQKSALDIRLPTVIGIKKAKGKPIKQLKIQSKLESIIKDIRLTPPKPRPKRTFNPDSGLPPTERIKMIMSAGIVKKTQSTMIEGASEESARKCFLFLKEKKII